MATESKPIVIKAEARDEKATTTSEVKAESREPAPVKSEPNTKKFQTKCHTTIYQSYQYHPYPTHAHT